MTYSSQYPNIFTTETTLQLHSRIDKLNPNSPALWGKMNVSQMLAHCCMPYLQVLGLNNQAPPALMKLLVKLLFKKSMTNTVPYKPGLPTAPAFVMKDEKEFEVEKNKLKSLLKEAHEKGANWYDDRAQVSLGKLSTQEWNNLLYKHIDHHLRQFGV